MSPAPFIAPQRVIAIASTTFTELVRLKLFYAVCAIAILLIGSSVLLARFSFQEEFQILKSVCFGVITIFSSLLAIVATANVISRDVEDRTAYAVLAKAVPRYEYVIGKLLGALSLIAVAVGAMSLCVFAVLALREHALIAELTGQPSADAISASNAIHRAASLQSIAPAACMILVRASVIATLTLFVSTLASSNTFTIVVMALVYFIANLQPMARDYWLQSHSPNLVARIFLAGVAIVFPDLPALDMTDAIAAGVIITLPLIAKAAALGLFYIVMYTLLAVLAFSGREL